MTLYLRCSNSSVVYAIQMSYNIIQEEWERASLFTYSITMKKTVDITRVLKYENILFYTKSKRCNIDYTPAWCQAVIESLESSG